MKKTHFKFDRLKNLGENFLFFEKYGQTYQCTCGCNGRYIPKNSSVDSSYIKECPSCKTKAIITFGFNKNSAGKEKIIKTYMNKLEICNDEFYINQRFMEFEINMEISIVNNQPHYFISKNGIKIINDQEYSDLRMYYILDKKNKRKLKTDYKLKKEKLPFNTSTRIYLHNDSFIDHVNKGLKQVTSDMYSNTNLWSIHTKYKYAPDLTLAGYTYLRGNSKELKIMNDIFINEKLHPLFNKMIEKIKILKSNDNPLYFYNFSYIFRYDYNYNGRKHIFNEDFIKFCLEIDNETALLFKDEICINDLLKFLYDIGYSSDDANKFMIVASRQHANLNGLYQYRDNIELLRKNNVEIEKLPKDIRIFMNKLSLLTNISNNNKDIEYSLNEHDLIIKSIQYYAGAEKVTKYIKNNSDDFFKTLSLITVDIVREKYIPCEIIMNKKQVEDIIVFIDRDIKIIKKIYTNNKIYTDINEIEKVLSDIEKGGNKNG